MKGHKEMSGGLTHSDAIHNQLISSTVALMKHSQATSGRCSDRLEEGDIGDRLFEPRCERVNVQDDVMDERDRRLRDSDHCLEESQHKDHQPT